MPSAPNDCVGFISFQHIRSHLAVHALPCLITSFTIHGKQTACTDFFPVLLKLFLRPTINTFRSQVSLHWLHNNNQLSIFNRQLHISYAYFKKACIQIYVFQFPEGQIKRLFCICLCKKGSWVNLKKIGKCYDGFYVLLGIESIKYVGQISINVRLN